jgi:Amt family ammonium transporter
MGIAVAYSFTVSYLIFKFINFILPLRVSASEEDMGLDQSQHNEKYIQGTLLVKNNGVLKEEELIS